jgi:hypothetical protein
LVAKIPLTRFAGLLPLQKGGGKESYNELSFDEEISTFNQLLYFLKRSGKILFKQLRKLSCNADFPLESKGF